MSINENDDFADDKEIQKSRKEREDYERMLDESIRILSKELFLEKAPHKNMKSFLMFNTLTRPILRKSYMSIKDNFPLQVSVVEYYSSGGNAKAFYSGTDLYFFGMLSLRQEFPLTYIYKETLREKIVNLFVKGDVDFTEDRKFSSRFELVTKDKNKLSILFLNKPLDELTEFPDMELEINGNSCLFRVSRKPVSEDEAQKFAGLAGIMYKIFT